MKFKCSVMFDNFTFEFVEGNLEEIKQKLKNLYDEEYIFPDNSSTTGHEFIAGWGKLSLLKHENDIFNMKLGNNNLNKYEDIDKLLTNENIQKALDTREEIIKNIIKKTHETLNDLEKLLK